MDAFLPSLTWLHSQVDTPFRLLTALRCRCDDDGVAEDDALPQDVARWQPQAFDPRSQDVTLQGDRLVD
jgi:hypothetical protein